MQEFTRCLPVFLASEFWTDLPEQNRAELFCRAAESDENLAFVTRYIYDQSINVLTKGRAFNRASLEQYNFSRKATEEQAPQIALC